MTIQKRTKRIFLYFGLTKTSRYAVVDREDFDRASEFRWHLSVYDQSGKTFYYARRWINSGGKSKHQDLHRFILNAQKGEFVDHDNHNGLDCRRENIRICTHGENMANRERRKDKKTSQYKGVYLTREKKWMSEIRSMGKRIYLGTFLTEKEAAVAYNTASKKYHGEFSLPNFVPS